MAGKPPLFKARLPINITPTPKASRTNLSLEPPTAEDMDSTADLEDAKKELHQQYELERQKRLVAETRIEELLVQKDQQDAQLDYLGHTIEDLKDTLENNSANALKSASIRSTKATSERSSIAGAQDDWTDASDSLHPHDAESRTSGCSSSKHDHGIDKGLANSDARVVQAVVQTNRVKSLEEKLRQKEQLQFQSQKQVKRLEVQVSNLRDDNKKLMRQLAYMGKMQKISHRRPVNARSHQPNLTSTPKRPAFDGYVTGGVPDWAKGSFIYDGKQTYSP